MEELNRDSELFNQEDVEYNQKIKPVERPSKNVGIDTDNQFMINIADAGLAGKLDMAAFPRRQHGTPPWSRAEKTRQHFV